MTQATPKVTVIVPTYMPGDGLAHVFDSLDAQTMPTDSFEVILIDDGSPDDTFGRLQSYAATRPHVRTHRIENSGWPSKPRNVATSMARGTYVFYMDHDDSLYPNALRRIVEYAEKTSADVLNVKESKTSDAWWCMPALAAGNSEDLKQHHRIDRMLPMVPHKLYRRAFLNEHSIRYPEGRRMLWEDVHFNVAAYAKAERVAIVADTPVYLWHSSGGNNSKSYGPTDVEFWDRMDDLMASIDHSLSDPALVKEHRSALMHQYRSRILRRLGKALQKAPPKETAIAVQRARQIQDRYIPEEWDVLAGPWEAPRAQVLRADRPDLLAALHRHYGTMKGRTEVTDLRWGADGASLRLRSGWHDSTGAPVVFQRRDDRLVYPLPKQFAPVLGAPWIDLTEFVEGFTLTVGVNERTEKVTWQLPLEQQVEQKPAGDGVTLQIVGEARLDAASAAYGQPLTAGVWDVLAVTRWAGLARTGGVRTRLDPQPALRDGVPLIAYATKKGTLALDTAQRLRSVVSDGRAVVGPVGNSTGGFTLDLPGVDVSAESRLDVEVVLVDHQGEAGRLAASLVGDAAGARLEVSAAPPAGRHLLRFATAEGEINSRYQIVVDESGVRLLTIEPEPQRRGTLAEAARSALSRLRSLLAPRG